MNVALSARWPPTFGPSRSAWAYRSAYRQLYSSDYIHHRHLLLLSPKADAQFTIPRRVEGWVDLAGWLHTETLIIILNNRSKCVWQ